MKVAMLPILCSDPARVTNHARTPMKHRSGYLVVTLLIVGGTLAACAGREPAAPDGNLWTPPGASSWAPAAAPDDCSDVAEAVEQHVASPAVGSVVVVGQCTLVVIETSLADDAYAAAFDLCTQAAEVAYAEDVNAVTVKAESGDELAMGVTDVPCLAM